MTLNDLPPILTRIAEALERLAPPEPAPFDFTGAVLFRYRGAGRTAAPAPDYPLPLDLLLGIETQKTLFVEAVRRFSLGLPSNHALLWGVRGVGKSSLVKAAVIAQSRAQPALKLMEIDRDDLVDLPALFDRLRGRPDRVIVFCDDLSFREGERAAKSMKSALEGGVFGAPPNVLFVATSNRRHLSPESADEGRGLIAVREEAEETVSVSDRFGLWIGFHPMTQDDYLSAVRTYAARFDLPPERLDARALQWAQRRGGRSGRVAYQFIKDLAGEAGVDLPL